METRDLIRVDAFDRLGADHFFGTRDGPRPGPGGPRLAGRPLATARQVHGTTFAVVRDGGTLPEGHEADGVIGTAAETWIGVWTADCLPILLAAETAPVVAAIHAGWRGSMERIVFRAVERLESDFAVPPEAVWAALGPAIGPCCYRVGPDVLAPLRARFPGWEERITADRVRDHALLDLAGWNRLQLIDAGIAPERIIAVNRCTRCDPERFSSYRREGKGMQPMLSAIRPPARPRRRAEGEQYSRPEGEQ